MKRSIKFLNRLVKLHTHGHKPRYVGKCSLLTKDDATIWINTVIRSKNTVYEVRLFSTICATGRSTDLNKAIINCERHLRSKTTQHYNYITGFRSVIE